LAGAFARGRQGPDDVIDIGDGLLPLDLFRPAPRQFVQIDAARGPGRLGVHGGFQTSSGMALPRPRSRFEARCTGSATEAALDAALDAARLGAATANDSLAADRRLIGRDCAFHTF
jgi:hypothetical protein